MPLHPPNHDLQPAPAALGHGHGYGHGQQTRVPVQQAQVPALASRCALDAATGAAEPLFDDLLALAAQTCGAPMALLTLTDGPRHWLQAQRGAPANSGVSGASAQHAHSLATGDVWQLPAHALQSIWSGHRDGSVDAAPAWALAAPLIAPDGSCVGALWLLDGMARPTPADLLPLLQSLARIACRAELLRRQMPGALSMPGMPSMPATPAPPQPAAGSVCADGAQLVSQIADRVPMRMAYFDRDGRYRYANLAHCRRLGLARDAVIGRLRSDFANDVGQDASTEHARAALAGELQSFELDEVINGQVRRMDCRLIPDVDAQGRVRGLFATAVDITERKATEQRLRDLVAVLDHTPDFVVQADARGRIIYMNPAVRRLLGMAPDEPVAERKVAEFNTPATNQLYRQTIIPTVLAQGVWMGETTVYGAGQREIPVNHMVIAHRSEAGQVERFSAVMRDITAELRTRQQEQRQAAALRSVTEAIPATVAVVGNDGHYRMVNSAFENWYGTRRDGVVGRRVADVLGEFEFAHRAQFIERALAGEAVHFERDFTEGDRSRHMAVSYVPLRLPDGSIDGFVSVAHDITAHKHEAGRLRHLSERDGLTGLLNRAGLENYLQRQLKAGAATGLALLYIDLDRFKPINDQHGHGIGDQVLQHFAQRLQKLVRPSDAVARLGGDEFIIVLAGVADAAPARSVADKVLAAAAAPFKLGELQLSVAASVGVALGADASADGQDLLQRADAMLYRAKQAGRGQHALDEGLPPPL